jgi:hypothetical protein
MDGSARAGVRDRTQQKGIGYCTGVELASIARGWRCTRIDEGMLARGRFLFAIDE